LDEGPQHSSGVWGTQLSCKEGLEELNELHLGRLVCSALSRRALKTSILKEKRDLKYDEVTERKLVSDLVYICMKDNLEFLS
jgi:hypothetical protein